MEFIWQSRYNATVVPAQTSQTTHEYIRTYILKSGSSRYCLIASQEGTIDDYGSNRTCSCSTCKLNGLGCLAAPAFKRCQAGLTADECLYSWNVASHSSYMFATWTWSKATAVVIHTSTSLYSLKVCMDQTSAWCTACRHFFHLGMLDHHWHPSTPFHFPSWMLLLSPLSHPPTHM